MTAVGWPGIHPGAGAAEGLLGGWVFICVIALPFALVCGGFARLRCRSLLFSGVAGGLDPALGVGDVVIGERVIQHDYGALHDSGLRSYRPGTIPIGDRSFAPDAAIGIAMYPDHGEDPQTLVRNGKLAAGAARGAAEVPV